MKRSSSPVRLHVNRKVPVHVHVSSTPVEGKSSVRRMKANDWAKASSSRGSWVCSPSQTGRNKMSWKGPTHRLDIEPVDDNGTRLHVSDLDNKGSTDIILEPDEGSTHKLDTLAAEVNHLKAELDLQKSLRDLEEKELDLRASRMSLRDKEIQINQLESVHEKLAESSKRKAELNASIAQLKVDIQDASQMNINRDIMMKKMLEIELDLGQVNHQINLVKESLRLLIRDKILSPSRARTVNEQSHILSDKLSEIHISMKNLRKTIVSQRKYESRVKYHSEEVEVLLQHISDMEATMQQLQDQIAEKETLAIHSHQLHDKLTKSETENQSLNYRIQSLKDQLCRKEMECSELESSLHETKQKAQLDQDILKKATKQHKEKAMKHEITADSLGHEVNQLNSKLEIEQSRSSRLGQENTHYNMELQTLQMQIKELQDSLDECRRTNKTAMDTYAMKLRDKSRDCEAQKIENEKLKTSVDMLESKLRANEVTGHTKISTAQSQIAELQCTISQYESLLSDYKLQLEKSHQECEKLAQELQNKEHEMDQAQHDSFMEMEKSKIKFQQQLSDIDPIKDRLRDTATHLTETQERLAICEQKNTDQNKLIGELSTQVNQLKLTNENLKEKLHGKKLEEKSRVAQLEITDKRLQESEVQNRDLIIATGKKEEIIQQLQKKEQQHLEELASLNRQLDTMRADSRKQTEELRERSVTKERSHLAHIVDLEAQLNRATSQSNQLRKSKEESEIKLQSRIHELQERLDQSHATKRSLENYINFLKSSYASIFNDNT